MDGPSSVSVGTSPSWRTVWVLMWRPPVLTPPPGLSSYWRTSASTLPRREKARMPLATRWVFPVIAFDSINLLKITGGDMFWMALSWWGGQDWLDKGICWTSGHQNLLSHPQDNAQSLQLQCLFKNNCITSWWCHSLSYPTVSVIWDFTIQTGWL